MLGCCRAVWVSDVDSVVLGRVREGVDYGSCWEVVLVQNVSGFDRRRLVWTELLTPRTSIRCMLLGDSFVEAMSEDCWSNEVYWLIVAM